MFFIKWPDWIYIRESAILVHGDIDYKFCWLLPFEDQTHDTPIRNELTG